MLHPAVDGRRHGRAGNVRSQALPAVRRKALPVDEDPQHLPGHRHRASTTSRSAPGLENIAKVMDRGTLIRSHVQPDLGSILHSRHQYHWHTGYVPPQTVAAPHIGAWMARVLGPRNPVMPAFINIGQRLEGARRKRGTQGLHHRRILRREFGPLNLPVSRRRRALGPPAQGHGPRPLRQPLQALSETRRCQSRTANS